MPVWHELTQQARESEQIVVLGVIQEQHPDRCQLFAQWQQFDWPILHDPINAVAARAVPMFIAIDEAGVVVDANLRADEYESFLARPANQDANQDANRSAAETETTEPATASPTSESTSTELSRTADARVLWHPQTELDEAIEEYEQAVELDPTLATAHFGRGVAYRMRFDSGASQPDDFARAVEAWGRALELDPNHYIYRRRIEQYGPRLIKPYPFYDWVEQAQRDIVARGDEPLPLSVQPSGAEIAQPSREFTADEAYENPDPEGKITRAEESLVTCDVVTVPAKVAPGDAVRVHLRFTLSESAHWNNEASPMKIWIDAPAGWQVAQPLLTDEPPTEPESHEVRTFEFEVKTPASIETDATNSATPLPTAYALFFVCEEVGGQCLFLRQDIDIPIQFRAVPNSSK